MSMRRRVLSIGLVLAAIGLLMSVSGCGGGGSSSSTDAAKVERNVKFSAAGKNKPIVTFGKEASAEEREAVDAIIVESLTAREEGDFAVQCKTLNKTGLEEIPKVESPADCPQALKKFAEPLSATKEVRKDTLPGSIDVFRVEGDFGYALFHGNDGKDHALALKKEGGDWKLSAINTIELGPTKTDKGSEPQANSKSKTSTSESDTSASKPEASNNNPQ